MERVIERTPAIPRIERARADLRGILSSSRLTNNLTFLCFAVCNTFLRRFPCLPKAIEAQLAPKISTLPSFTIEIQHFS